MPSDGLDVSCANALAYEITEEVHLTLGRGEVAGELADARCCAGEAAYYISDAIEPEDRAALRALAARRCSGGHPGDDPASEALSLIAEAEDEVTRLLRGPAASSELGIALRALRRGSSLVAAHLGLLDEPEPSSRRRPVATVLRRLEARR